MDISKNNHHADYIKHLKFSLKFFGPAWLVMIADMDASSTIGAAETGALFKYGLIWFMILLIVPLYLVQELSGRIGIATSKGLGDVIRENYSRKTAVLMSFPMGLTDVVTYIIEYIGIAIGLELMGVPIFISLPIIYMVHLFVVSRRRYGRTEKILIPITLILIVAFIVTLFLRGPVNSSPIYIVSSPSYIFMLAVNVGAVIMPFMLFFQASATAAKVKHIKLEGFLHNDFQPEGINEIAVHSMKRETIIGATVSEFLMVIVEMVFSGIPKTTNFASPSQLASALDIVAGRFSPYLFGIGLIAAGFIALIVISMGSAWGIVESLGIKKDNTFKVYVLESLPAVIAGMLIPATMLVNAVLYLLVVFVFVLIGPGIIMGLIGKNKNIMGNLASKPRSQLFYWGSLAFVIMFGIMALF
ncbi:MAG: divalent metal cation transporter [Ferroplasma sp.]